MSKDMSVQLVWKCVQEGPWNSAKLDQGARVSTRQKTVSRVDSSHAMTDAASQSELWWEHASTQVLGCRMYPAPVAVPGGNSGHSRGSCTQEELLHKVTKQRWVGWGLSGRDSTGFAPWLPWVRKTGHGLYGVLHPLSTCQNALT